MNVQIILSEPDVVYSNHDLITGDVVLYCPSTTHISSVSIEFSGESQTLGGELGGPGPFPRRVKESHQIVSHSMKLFPDKGADSSKKARITLPFGYHAFPFAFRVPFTNSCKEKPREATRSVFTVLDKFKPKSAQHVSNILPPSMTSSSAEIHYRLEAVVSTISIFQQNLSALVPIRFSPYPQPDLGQRELASEPTVFWTTSKAHASIWKDEICGTLSSLMDLTSRPVEKDPTTLTLNARLPPNASIPCGEPIPLRLFLKGSSYIDCPLILESFHLAVVGNTYTRAQGSIRKDVDCWVIQSLSNLNMFLGGSQIHPLGTEIHIDHEFCSSKPLPPPVVPTFYICNVARSYQLQVRVGVRYGDITPRQVVLELQMPVHIQSNVPITKHIDNVPTPPPSPDIVNDGTRINQRSRVDDWPPPYCSCAGIGTAQEGAAPPSYEEALAFKI